MSKAFYFILALAIAGGSLAITNPFDLPLVYAQTVTTKGNNYDLIEDLTIGEAKWTSHPERIMVNGEWENYFLQADNQKIIFRSNSVGGFIYDIPSCSYSIYENGFTGNQIIPSVSAVATKNVNGQWQNMEVNNESCDVTFTRNLNGIEIFSTKTLTENFNIQTTNGTITTNSTQTEKFVQELKVDIFGGIKETFKVWNESNEPLGISQTVHTGDSIIVGNNELNISQYNGQSFDKQFLEANELQVFEIANNLNYDFDLGFDSLTGINIISESGFFSSTNKVNLDYASGDFVNYLEIDPTFSATPSSAKSLYDTSGDNVCNGNTIGSTSTSNGYVRTYNTAHSYDCIRVWYEWDISSIPDSATITDTQFEYDIVDTTYGSYNCDIVQLTNQPSTNTNSQTWSDITNGLVYVDNTNQCTTGTGVNDLGSNADTELENNLSTDWFALGMKLDDEVLTSSIRGQEIEITPTLQVTYSIPTYPQPPTNLQTVTGIPIEVSWTAPVDDGGSSLTGYKVYRTLNQYVMTELPNNGGTTPVDFTDNELLLHGESFYGVNRDSTYDGTNVGATTGATGKVDSYAWNFDGSNDYVGITQQPVQDNTDYSASVWVKFDTVQTSGFVDMTDDDLEQEDFQIWYRHGTTDFRCDKRSDNTTEDIEILQSTTTPTTGQWYHIVCVYDDSVANDQANFPQGAYKMYVNGVLEDDTTTSGTDGARAKGVNQVWLGDYDNTYYFDGQMDQLLIYNKALSSSEVSALYNSGSGTSTPDTNGLTVHYDFEQTGSTLESQTFLSQATPDNSPNTLTVTTPSGTTTTGVFNNAISTPNLEVTSSLLPDATDSFTVGSWVKQTATPTNTKLLGFTNSNGDNIVFNIGTTTADFKVNTTPIISATGLTDNTSDFQHYALSRDGSSWTLYQNGQSVATATDSTNLGTVSGSHKINLDGSIDEYFIDSTALTSNEIQTVYGMGSEPALLTTTGTTPSYDDSGVTGGNTYYYYVKATNAIGDSGFSVQVSGLAGTPPNPPTSVTTSITNVNTNPLDVLIQWSAPTNVGSGTLTGFEIVRDGSVVATVGLVSSYTDTVPGAGTYTYLVRAISTHGTSSDSNTSNITTPNPPSAINNLSATVNSDTAIALSWSSPNNGGSAITIYKVFQDAVQIDTTTNTSYTVTGLSPNTSYDFTVVASNNVGDSTASNTATETTYLEITGQIDLTATTQGSTTQFVFSANVTAGTPTPTFSTFDIKENGITIASNVSSPYNLKLTDTATHTYTIISTDNTHWNTPSINGTVSGITASYQADWQTDLLGTNEVAYNLSRANDQLNLVVNRDTGTNTWHLNCNYRTNTQILAGNNGTWYEVNSWYYDDTQSISDASIVYIDCYNDDLILQITSYSSDRTGGGIAVLNGFFEDWTGTPVALFFVLLVAGLFSGRTAPTGILLILAIVGVMAFVGLLVIDEAIWAFVLLVGILGLFVGKRFL